MSCECRKSCKNYIPGDKIGCLSFKVKEHPLDKIIKEMRQLFECTLAMPANSRALPEDIVERKLQKFRYEAVKWTCNANSYAKVSVDAFLKEKGHEDWIVDHE
ncbi:MAG: hypothetical protein GY861_27030 [bacterium]|nr:hypothetical protein [bacterium]